MSYATAVFLYHRKETARRRGRALLVFPLPSGLQMGETFDPEDSANIVEQARRWLPRNVPFYLEQSFQVVHVPVSATTFDNIHRAVRG